jgi:hypothetical protein
MDAVIEKSTFHKLRTADVLRRLAFMRVFGVNKKELFEYKEQLFGYEHAEKELEEWVRSDPAVVVEGLDARAHLRYERCGKSRCI